MVALEPIILVARDEEPGTETTVVPSIEVISRRHRMSFVCPPILGWFWYRYERDPAGPAKRDSMILRGWSHRRCKKNI